MLPFLSLVSVAELARNPTVKDEFAAAGLAVDVRPDVHLPGPSGGRHPVLQGQPGPGRQGPAAPPGARPGSSPAGSTTATARARRFPGARGRCSATRPLLLGTDGSKMSKSRGNAIALGASADETARLIRGREDRCRAPHHLRPGERPEVSNLVLLAALAWTASPSEVADEIGARGAARSRPAHRGVNERLRVRARRAEFAGDPGYLRQVLRDGTSAGPADRHGRCAEVRARMHTDYPVTAPTRRPVPPRPRRAAHAARTA